MQREALAAYAAQHGLTIVREYCDEGRSGLSLAGRDQLKALLADVLEHRADYSTILVYDVSRWGRFQDTDQAAYYEFVCRHAGVRVVYCKEPFPSDASPLSAVVKSIKRIMAGEYSRELSEKVYAAKAQVVRSGFFPGASAPLGMRRKVVPRDGGPGIILQHGEWKWRQDDRITLVPGPPDEIKWVRWIFRAAASGAWWPHSIARHLNDQGVRNVGGTTWKECSIRSMLHNEKYIGNLVYGQTAQKLKGPRVWLPEDKWLRADGIFTPIISRRLFDQAQAALARRSQGVSEEEGLEMLRQLYRKHGRLSLALVDSAQDLPGSTWYRRRFGNLRDAFQRVGFTPNRRFGARETFGARLRLIEGMREGLAERLRCKGARVEPLSRVLMSVNGVTVGTKMAFCRDTIAGPQWVIQMTRPPRPRWLLAVRLDKEAKVMDYWVTEGDRCHVQLAAPLRRPRREFRSASLDEALHALLQVCQGEPAMSGTGLVTQAAAQTARARRVPNMTLLLEAMTRVLRGKTMRALQITEELVKEGFACRSYRLNRMVAFVACTNADKFRRIGGCWYALTEAAEKPKRQRRVRLT